jgi:hypothetical protein
MNLLRQTLLSLLVLSTACTDFVNRGSPCGGTLQVDAEAVLPDTGLGAGGKANISFSETNHTLDESSLIVWTFPPSNTTFTDSPPRVRVLTSDGRVFLDLQAMPAYIGSWYVLQPIPNGPLREEIVSAFQAGLGVVEFSSAQPNQKVTRVRPDVRFAGRTPVLQCL